MRMAVMFCGCLSYRRAADMMNTVLHRTADEAIKVRTLADFIEDYGNGIGSHMKTLAADILKANQFDAETLAPEDTAAFKASIASEPREVRTEAAMAEVCEKVKEINSQREPRAQIKRDDLVSAVELPTTRCCYASVDDIGVKHQKETRKNRGSKTGRYVENTVIHVQADGLCYHLTAVGMKNAFAALMAFLLNNHLMENRRLVFLADGARNILNHIETLFPFCERSVILDWYHLKKKCKELISSSVKGTKEEKKVIIQDVLRMLWVGNVDETVEYLNSLEHKSIKSRYWLGELTGYLERKRPQIACYALRDSFGLRNSSNRVEKNNDLLVAQRQKHNGMSWSREGSGALAAINMVLLNKEAEQWLYTRTLSFSMFSDVDVAA
ncbi:MAG: hypothetical protein LBK56_01635 [Gracilibacteraceae bacterium]|nr:hypothetical protein [Gracilibacteraceae bacterium]